MPEPREDGTILITGGAGFLGGHLEEALRGERLRVRILDREAPERATGSCELVRGDIREAAVLDGALDGVDGVIHLAFASPHAPPDRLRSVNVEGTARLCERARAHGASRLILVSSTIVEKAPRRHPFLSAAPLSRLDAYRASRLEAERIVLASGLSAAIVRPKTFIGPGRVGAFALIFEAIRKGGAIPVLGEGENRYQLLDIRDMADAIRRLVRSGVEGILGLGAARFGTVREDLAGLAAHAGTGAELRFVPAGLSRAGLRAMELLALKPLSEWHYSSARGLDSVVDTTRAREELGWTPSRSNLQALCGGYDWYVETLARTGEVRTTHAVPRSHRLLETFRWLLPR